MSSPAEDQPGFAFEIEDRDAQDLILLRDILDDFNGDFQATSDFIAYVYMITQAKANADGCVSRRLVAVRDNTGTLPPELQAISEEELAEYFWREAPEIGHLTVDEAISKFWEAMSGLREQAQVDRITKLLSILGLSLDVNKVRYIERDEERARKIITAAKLMDANYREFAGSNLELIGITDPETAQQLRGIIIEDPEAMQIRQWYRELKDEI